MWIRTIVAAMFAGVFMGSHVHADNGQWTTVASACVPAPSTTGYVWQGSAVFLPGPATVVLRCNVTDPADFANFVDPVWNTIEVTYRDSDGMANDSRVRVQLVRVGRGTGATFLTGTFDSNAFAAGTLNSANFVHPFDFENFGYFVQLTLTRTPAGGDTSIYRVRLW